MPKSSNTASPPYPTTLSKPPLDIAARMTDVALRKKKNADAQAAFRARRANYIATLEETVTSLESVVIQLQESCRESRSESVELRQENTRLRLENREREKLWRALYHAKKTGRAPEVDDLPPPPLSSPFVGHNQLIGLASHSAAPVVQPPYGNSLEYRGEDPAACQPSYSNVPSGSGTNFGNQSPSLPFPSNDNVSGGAVLNLRAKYATYPYPISRDVRWQMPSTMTPNVSGESGSPPHSHSPAYIESPTLTSAEMSAYPGRFSGEDPKVTLNSVLDSAPYVFPNGDRFHHNVGDSVPNSRSMSPTSSTPSSTASLHLTSSFPFTFQEPPPGQDCTDFDYRRQSLPQCPEVTLHGGTADISLTSHSSDGVRYRVGRRPDSVPDRQPVLSVSENGSQHDQNNSDGDIQFSNQHLHSRRTTIQSHSRSPSPGPAAISCTVAVIKAQAFGALRRTRARTKRTAEGAVKVAKDVLEARGIDVGGVSAGSKRPHPDDDDEDLEADTP